MGGACSSSIALIAASEKERRCEPRPNSANHASAFVLGTVTSDLPYGPKRSQGTAEVIL